MRFYLVIFLFVSATAQATEEWPVCYNAEKGPAHLLISREALPLAAYTNEFPSWNYDLRNHARQSRINSTELKELGRVGGLRVVEVRLSLTDIYYTDMLMILEEVKQGQFLPVYVQIYNRAVRAPSDSVVTKDKKSLTVNTSMDYEGTGHFHDLYKITISPNHDPVIVGLNK